MSELGESAIKAIEFLSLFYNDVSKLLGCIEDNMVNRRLVSYWGTTAVWGRSTVYCAQSGWIPRYFWRGYVPVPGEKQKPDPIQQRVAFFAAYLVPKFCQEPAAMWGVASLIEPGELWPPIGPLMVRDDGPPFLRDVSVPEWVTLTDLPKGIRSLEYRACRLVDLVDTTRVEELVVNPLMERFGP